jgi:hypothetical protein
MTITELIAQLEAIRAEHGDMPVKVLSHEPDQSWVDPAPEVNSNWLLL